MANRQDTQAYGGRPGIGRAPANEQLLGGGEGAPGQGGRAEDEGRAEGRSFGGPSASSEGAQLDDALKRYDTRYGRVHVDYGHDQNYRPGYHEGGSRFGFFGTSNDRGVDREQDFDADYLSWRERQMDRHDRDYADWRREQLRKYDDDYWRFRAERRDDFHQRFQDWRAQRDAEIGGPPDPPRTDETR
jgi:hypothetical protein